VTFNLTGTSAEVPDEVAGWAHQAGSSMMDADELMHLAATLATFQWTPDAIVVEIGAYIGQTTVFMARVLQRLGHRVSILSIDPFERVQPEPLNPQGIYAAYVANVKAAGVEDVCLPMAAFSNHAVAVVPDRVGVLVVDGGHHYPIVSDDLRRYVPKLLPRGLVFVDDYGGAYPGVMQAVDEFFTPDARFSRLHQSYFVVAQLRH